MIKRKYWTKKVLPVMMCAALLMTNPVSAEAATAAERNAYQAVFDADYYRSAYPDVQAAFGNNKTALFNHFVNYGLKEGRSCSADFNPQAYKAKYADLQQAFGDDMAAYCRHYVSYGKAEGRDGGGTGSASAATVTDAATTDTATVQGNVIGTCTTEYDATVPRAVNDYSAAYISERLCCSTDLYQWNGRHGNRWRCVPGIIDTLRCNVACRSSCNRALSAFTAGNISSGRI